MNSLVTFLENNILEASGTFTYDTNGLRVEVIVILTIKSHNSDRMQKTSGGSFKSSTRGLKFIL